MTPALFWQALTPIHNAAKASLAVRPALIPRPALKHNTLAVISRRASGEKKNLEIRKANSAGETGRSDKLCKARMNPNVGGNFGI